MADMKNPVALAGANRAQEFDLAALQIVPENTRFALSLQDIRALYVARSFRVTPAIAAAVALHAFEAGGRR